MRLAGLVFVAVATTFAATSASKADGGGTYYVKEKDSYHVKGKDPFYVAASSDASSEAATYYKHKPHHHRRMRS